MNGYIEEAFDNWDIDMLKNAVDNAKELYFKTLHTGDAKQLCRILQKNSTVKRLNLSWCELDKKQIEFFIEMLMKNSCIEVLTFDHVFRDHEELSRIFKAI